MIIKLLCVGTTGSFGGSLAWNSEGSIQCVPLNNRLFQDRPTIVNINSNQALYCPFTVSVSKCS